MKTTVFTVEDYISNRTPSWCKGCSFYGVHQSLCQMLAEKQVDPSKINVIAGIGCSSRLPFYLNTFGMHTLHGRAIPIAVGARLSRPDIPVIVVAGDGDLFSIGVGHFVHAARKNFKMTVICIDNRMFAMTKNQSSPTSPSGHSGSLSPQGKTDLPINVIDFAIGCNATFVARTFAGDVVHQTKILSQAFDHIGFSFVQILAPCQTFDKSVSSVNTEQMIDINQELSHNPKDRTEALKYSSTALDYDKDIKMKIPVGIFWTGCASIYEQAAPSVKDYCSKKTISPDELFTKYI